MLSFWEVSKSISYSICVVHFQKLKDFHELYPARGNESPVPCLFVKGRNLNRQNGSEVLHEEKERRKKLLDCWEILSMRWCFQIIAALKGSWLNKPAGDPHVSSSQVYKVFPFTKST